ncbi:MAG: hypothetical protein EPO21_23610 [Chloroflexota bacterium]|nr:MAG: hypothetical protein EPO21_23610 [Chloroflexota bacterium]
MRGPLTLLMKSRPWWISTRMEIAALGLITVLGAVLRLLWLDSIPAGWHHDEALMGVMAAEVYRGDQRPIFFPTYLGQEPLYIYLSAGMMWLLGGNQDILPLRLTSALMGLATIGVTYLLGREMFGRRTGLITSALVSLSFWQVMLSRGGYRLITQPLLEGLTIFLLWRAYRKNSTWYYAAAGAALGGCIYTYLGARLFPGVLVLFAMWGLLTHGRPSARLCRQVSLFLIVAAAVTAPLLLYFATHPGTFSARIDQVLVFQPGVVAEDPLRTLGENILKLLGSFTIQGETLWRYNVWARPIFVGAIGLLFYVGLIAAARDAVRKRAAGAMTIAWFAAMLFPAFLSYDVGAYTFRSMGLVPGLFLLPAVGLVAIWDWTTVRVALHWRRRTWSAFVALTVVILAIEGATTYREYFVQWAGSFRAAYENMDDMVDAARYLAREAKPTEEEIFISSEYYPHPVVTHLAPDSAPLARWFDGNGAIVLSPGTTKNSLYAFPFSARPQQMDRYLPAEGLVHQTFFTNGVTKLSIYRFTPAQVLASVNRILADPSFTRASGNLGGVAELLAYRVDRRVEQGGTLSVSVVWRILQDAPPQDYVTFTHLLDNQGSMRAQYDTSSFFPRREWRAGDIVLERYNIPVGSNVAPGKYTISLGMYDRATLEKLLVAGDAAGRDELTLDPVKVAGTQPPDLKEVEPVNKTLGPGIELQGFDLQRQSPSAGASSIDLTLYWRAASTPTKDYTVFVQLLGPDGRPSAQADSQPDSGRFPTSYWDPGETVVDVHHVAQDRNLAPGRHKLIAGMYLLSTGERLRLEDGSDYILIKELDVQ